MGYDTTTTNSFGDRLAGFGKAIGNTVTSVADLQQQQAQAQAKLQEMQDQHAQMAQQMQQQQVEMSNKGMQAQTGLLFTAAASEDPNAAAQQLVPRAAQWDKVTGQATDPKQFQQSASNMQKILGKDRLQRMVRAPSLVGDISATPDVNSAHYKNALADLSAAEPYMNPDQYASATKLIEDNHKEYLNYQKTVAAANIKTQYSMANADVKASKVPEKDLTALNADDEFLNNGQNLLNTIQTNANAEQDVVGPVAGRVMSTPAGSAIMTPEQKTFSQQMQQYRIDYEKAKGSVRAVASPALQTIMAKALPNVNDKPAQIINSLKTINSTMTVAKASKIAKYVQSKPASVRAQILDEVAGTTPHIKDLASQILGGAKDSDLLKAELGQTQQPAQGKLDLNAAFNAVGK